MSEFPPRLRIDLLQAGDLIFSTTRGVVSEAIRRGTNSCFSHVSIYFGDGVIIEANDDGVGPRRIVAEAIDNDEVLIGLPYEDWSACAVLRFDGDYSPESWEDAIKAALRDHVGLDFPPLSRMARGAPLAVRLLMRPIAWALDIVDWVRNREPMAYDSWCSRLVGFVLSERFGRRLTAEQRETLAFASPQRLFELAQHLGYSRIDACASTAQGGAGAAFERAKSALSIRQNETFDWWKTLAQSRRGAIRQEHVFRLLRAVSKLMGLLVLLTVAIAATEVVQLRNDPRPWAHPGPVDLYELSDEDACAFRRVQDMGWTEGHKTLFCRFNGYGGGNFNQGAYSNGGVCIRGPEPEVCRAFVKNEVTSDIRCSPNGVETVCRVTTPDGGSSGQ